MSSTKFIFGPGKTLEVRSVTHELSSQIEQLLDMLDDNLNNYTEFVEIMGNKNGRKILKGFLKQLNKFQGNFSEIQDDIDLI